MARAGGARAEAGPERSAAAGERNGYQRNAVWAAKPCRGPRPTTMILSPTSFVARWTCLARV